MRLHVIQIWCTGLFGYHEAGLYILHECACLLHRRPPLLLFFFFDRRYNMHMMYNGWRILNSVRLPKPIERMLC